MQVGASSRESGGGYPPFPECVPRGVIHHKSYRVRFAASRGELDAVLRLRYRVFNLELGEGLAESHATGRDEDPFDATCHHLVVERDGSGTVIGTYRMQTSTMAKASGLGFYSGGEYDLEALPEAVRRDSVEIGRACIAREHRNRQVLFLLWKGLARYMQTNRRRFLFGCCSLPTLEAQEGAKALAYLRAAGHVHPEIEVPALPGFECSGAAGDPGGDPGHYDLPPLFRTYLRYGAKVCSTPAVDRAFGTIDFLVLFDVEAMSPRSYQLFFE